MEINIWAIYLSIAGSVTSNFESKYWHEDSFDEDTKQDYNDYKVEMYIGSKYSKTRLRSCNADVVDRWQQVKESCSGLVMATFIILVTYYVLTHW